MPHKKKKNKHFRPTRQQYPTPPSANGELLGCPPPPLSPLLLSRSSPSLADGGSNEATAAPTTATRAAAVVTTSVRRRSYSCRATLHAPRWQKAGTPFASQPREMPSKSPSRWPPPAAFVQVVLLVRPLRTCTWHSRALSTAAPTTADSLRRQLRQQRRQLRCPSQALQEQLFSISCFLVLGKNYVSSEAY